MTDERRKRGCLGALLRGCLGCLAVLVTLVIVLALAAFALKPGPQDVKTVALAPEAAVPSSAVGRVVLELEEGTFRIEPGPPGSALGVEATSDVVTKALEQAFDAGPDGAWSWHVRFGPRGNMLASLLAGRRDTPQVTVRLPKDLPMELELRLSKGKSEVELGGLDLRSLEVRTSLGEHRLSFGEPLARPLEAFDMESSTGASRVDRLGNASPASAHFRSKLGELGVGLEGAWQRDAAVAIEWSTGSVRVVAPPDLRLVRGEITVRPGNIEIPALPAASGEPESGGAGPVIHLDAHGRFGDILVQR